MDHNTIRHKLSEYIDGAVTPQERAAIDGHLKTCVSCSDALAELRKTIEQVKQIEEVDAPVWMTSKIMANVRAEAAQGRSFFHRFFHPLAIKLPMQAVAMLFLAVTAFYIYQGINPAEKYTEAPTGALSAKRESAPREAEQDKLGKAEEPSRSARQAPQTPGYKALDMKKSYEPAPAPVLRDQAPPAPARTEEAHLAANETRNAEKRAFAPQAAALSVLAERAAQPSVQTSGGLSYGASRDAEPRKEMVAAESKAKSAYQAKSYVEFIRTIASFPYEAPPSRRDRIINNYGRLVAGMTKKEIALIVGDPDYASDAQSLDPPFRQQGTYWTYNLSIKDPKLVSLETDQFLNIFFDIGEKASSFSPHNIPGLAQKGVVHSRTK